MGLEVPLMVPVKANDYGRHETTRPTLGEAMGLSNLW